MGVFRIVEKPKTMKQIEEEQSIWIHIHDQSDMLPPHFREALEDKLEEYGLVLRLELHKKRGSASAGKKNLWCGWAVFENKHAVTLAAMAGTVWVKGRVVKLERHYRSM